MKVENARKVLPFIERLDNLNTLQCDLLNSVVDYCEDYNEVEIEEKINNFIKSVFTEEIKKVKMQIEQL
jgi:hypothetical protein